MLPFMSFSYSSFGFEEDQILNITNTYLDSYLARLVLFSNYQLYRVANSIQFNGIDYHLCGSFGNTAIYEFSYNSFGFEENQILNITNIYLDSYLEHLQQQP